MMETKEELIIKNLLNLKSRLEELLGINWTKELAPEFVKPYMQELSQFLIKERKTKTIYPSKDETFSALKLTEPDNINVVIIGSEPYHYKELDNLNNGLAFSIKETHLADPLPLLKIHKAIEESCYDGLNLQASTDFEYLTKQGVLLLNNVLTVQAKRAKSHYNKGWETFTDRIVEILNNKDKLVFILIGDEARTKSKLITNNHLVFELDYPAIGIDWDYKDVFSETNKFLKKEKNIEIIW